MSLPEMLSHILSAFRVIVDRSWNLPTHAKQADPLSVGSRFNIDTVVSDPGSGSPYSLSQCVSFLPLKNAVVIIRARLGILVFLIDGAIDDDIQVYGKDRIDRKTDSYIVSN
jgi:hypothetical protein